MTKTETNTDVESKTMSESPFHSNRKTPDSTQLAPADQRKSTCQSIIQAITAPAVLSGFGGSLMVASQSFVSCGIMVVISAISARNDLVARLNEDFERTSAAHNKVTVPSLRGFFERKASSPGLCTELQGWTYLATSFSSLVHGHPITSASFVIFSIGSWAGAALANERSREASHQPVMIERIANNIWQRIPDRVRVVLRDPAASFAVANLPIFARSLFSSLVSGAQASPSPVLLVGVCIGGLLTISAAAIGVRPLFTSEPPEPSGSACFIHGLGNLVLGTCVVWAASMAGQVAGFYTGGAAILWGFANFGYGASIERGRVAAKKKPASV